MTRSILHVSGTIRGEVTRDGHLEKYSTPGYTVIKFLEKASPKDALEEIIRTHNFVRETVQSIMD